MNNTATFREDMCVQIRVYSLQRSAVACIARLLHTWMGGCGGHSDVSHSLGRHMVAGCSTFRPGRTAGHELPAPAALRPRAAAPWYRAAHRSVTKQGRPAQGWLPASQHAAEAQAVRQQRHHEHQEEGGQ